MRLSESADAVMRGGYPGLNGVTGEATPARRPTTVRELAERTRIALAEAAACLRPQAVSLTFTGWQGYKWHLFLDQPIDATETCAISCAVVSLLSAGEPADSILIKSSIDTLLPLQLKSGGWTSWVLDVEDFEPEELEEPLVIDTYFALQALRAAGRAASPEYARGIDWFRSVHNAAEGGWGFYEGGHSQTLPTTMAIRTLAAGSNGMDPLLRDVVNRGIEWLLSIQESGGNGGWSQGPSRPSSSVHTALALLAMSAAGYDKYSPPMTAGREWLLDYADERESVIDHYVTPGRTTRGKNTAIRSITHINFPEGILLQGAVASGANMLDPRLLGLVEDLLAGQDREGYWKCLHAPRDQPVFAIMDACLALRAFSDAVQTHEAVLEVSERVQENEAGVGALQATAARTLEELERIRLAVERLQHDVQVIRTDVAGLEQRVRGLSASVETQARSISDLDRGLTLLKPLRWLTSLALRWPIVTLLVLLQLIAYGIGAFTVDPKFRLFSWAGGLLLTVTAAITFWMQTYHSNSGPPSRKDDP